MNEKDSKVEHSSTAKTTRRTFLKVGAALLGATLGQA